MRTMRRGESAFGEVVELLRQGYDVSEEELSDAWGYASDATNELFRFTKSLLSGYRAQQAAIKRKDAIIEAKIQEIGNMKRTIWVLNQKIRTLTGKAASDGEEPETR